MCLVGREDEWVILEEPRYFLLELTMILGDFFVSPN